MKKIIVLVAIALGIAYWLKPQLKHFLSSGSLSASTPDTVYHKQETSPSYHTDGDIADEIINGDTTLLELPRLAGGNKNYFLTHRAGGRVNYSMEYDVTKLHTRWVAFSFDRETAQDRVPRTDTWGWDPKLPAIYDTSNFFRRSGYSRGHLVASEDRTFSKEANEQTFYYSNMSPQLQAHNAGIWHRLEHRVQSWGRDRSFCDILYVAKGGTIREDQILPERLKGKMVIPQYYWMALLMKRGKSYHSLAFLTEHKVYPKGARIDELTLSVRELEQFTGLDFFHHLPDEIEQAVETESPQSRQSRQLWWKQ